MYQYSTVQFPNTTKCVVSPIPLEARINTYENGMQVERKRALEHTKLRGNALLTKVGGKCQG